MRVAPSVVPDAIAGLKTTAGDRPLPAGLLNFGGISQSIAPITRELQIENTNNQSVTLADPIVTGGFVLQTGPMAGTIVARRASGDLCARHANGYDRFLHW